MIKRLRLKFICVVMAVVILMVGGILGVVIHFTATGMENQSVNMMHAIAARPFQLANLGKYSEEVRLPFFAVQISSRGELISTTGGYFDLTDREYIQKIVNAALTSPEEHGELRDHNLRYLKAVNQLGYTVVFADTTTEEATVRHLAVSCLKIFLFAITVFMGLSIALSYWVTRPVAKAWNQQRQFVADASHEMKTPLAIIMSNAELMQNEDTELAECRKFSKNILSTTYQMRTLVENMLEMARVDNGTLKMHFAKLDLRQLVMDAVLSFQLLYEEKEMGLRCAASENIFVSGSEQHLYQVMDVLLDNALKYSTQKGMVSVDLKRNGRVCLLSVSSPGEALSQEELKNIFNRFYRTDKSRAINGSYGLGLSIAASVVTAHKGRIWAESEQGYNTFYVQLPIHLHHPQTDGNLKD